MVTGYCMMILTYMLSRDFFLYILTMLGCENVIWLSVIIKLQQLNIYSLTRCMLQSKAQHCVHFQFQFTIDATLRVL